MSPLWSLWEEEAPWRGSKGRHSPSCSSGRAVRGSVRESAGPLLAGVGCFGSDFSHGLIVD